MEDNKQAEEPIIMEVIFAVDLNEVWQAITDKDQMKEWYFDIKDFRPEPGAEFKFYAGD
ncbi:MAG TPA: SRPBCC domain-containing protein, partial [Chryseolinea sp.]|nr:SRPBCC domain-containing protein [Chryseolinea sp.]